MQGAAYWKVTHAEVTAWLAVDDVLLDSMRGRSSSWTRVRVNLRHVPPSLRPEQAAPEPDDAPTRGAAGKPKRRGK